MEIFKVHERVPRKLSMVQTDDGINKNNQHNDTEEILDPLTMLALKDLDPLSRMQKEVLSLNFHIIQFLNL